MTRTSQLVRDFQDAGAMSRLVNLYGFVDDGVFLAKSGDVGVVFALDGIDYECLDAHQRDLVSRRFEVALRIWDERIHLYQYVLKRNGQVPSDASVTSCHVDELLQRRNDFFESKAERLYSLSLYLVVIQEADRSAETLTPRLRRALRTPAATVRDWLSTDRTVVRLDEEIERSRGQLRQKAEAFALQLQDTVHPRVLGSDTAFRFFRRLLNYAPGKADAVRLRQDTLLDYDACDSFLECHRAHLRLDNDYVRVVTLKEPPAQTFAHLFQALYEIPSNLILVSEWQREGQGAVRREIHAKRRHFHNARVSLTNYVTDTTTPGDMLIDDSAAAVVRDLGACLTELTLQGRYFGQYTMTVVLYDRDPVALERSVAACAKAFSAHDGQVTDERYNLLNAWLAVLPGNAAYNVRSMHLLNTNYADLSLLFSQNAGAERTPI
jgi:type IV secretion system protein TrbE